jgi:hypothetical protein
MPVNFLRQRYLLDFNRMLQCAVLLSVQRVHQSNLQHWQRAIKNSHQIMNLHT